MIKPTTLGEGVLHGVNEPEVFEPDILLKGSVHHVFNKAEGAKTWIALWLAVQALKRGQRVVYLDMENGKKKISERLQHLDVPYYFDTPGEIDRLFHYYPFPSLTMHHTAVQDFTHVLDRDQPELVIFDSWVNFLSGCGLDESNNPDVANWASKYLFPAKQRGITTVVLDHVGHDGGRYRGATRKKDECDVQWKVSTKKFNRKRIGEVNFKLEKDREAYLPDRVAFKVGGSPFIFDRTDAPEETPVIQLTGNAKKLYDFLLQKSDQCATYSELLAHFGGESKKSSLKKAMETLEEQGLLFHDGKGSPYCLVNTASEHETELVEEETAA